MKISINKKRVKVKFNKNRIVEYKGLSDESIENWRKLKGLVEEWKQHKKERLRERRLRRR